MNREICVVRAVLILTFGVGAVGGADAADDKTEVTVPLPQFTTQASATTLYCTPTVSTHLGAQDAETQKDGKLLPAHATAAIEKTRHKLRLQIKAENVEVADEFEGKFPIVLQYRILNNDPAWPSGLLAILDHSKVGGQVHVIALNRVKGTMISISTEALEYAHPSSDEILYTCSPTL
jgi:hypothetical protein